MPIQDRRWLDQHQRLAPPTPSNLPCFRQRRDRATRYASIEWVSTLRPVYADPWSDRLSQFGEEVQAPKKGSTPYVYNDSKYTYTTGKMVATDFLDLAAQL